MTALDQAFIKAYLQQAGAAHHCGRKPSEGLEMSSPAQKAGLSGEEEGAPCGQTFGQRVQPDHDSQTERLSSGQESPSAWVPPGDKTQQSGRISPSKPDSPAPSLRENREVLSMGTEQRAETLRPGRRRKKCLPRPGALSLGEVLDQKDRQSSVGLPNRRTVEKLAIAARPAAGPGHAVLRGPHFLSKRARKSAPQRNQILPFCQQSEEPTSDNAPDSAPEVAHGEHPECILEFPGSFPQKAQATSGADAKASQPKLPKNPRKITLRDLEIPREVCFFEPPSPTIPLKAEPQNTKIRGMPELPRPLERPRLSLYRLESQPEESSRRGDPAWQSVGRPGGIKSTGSPGGVNVLSLTPAHKYPQEKQEKTDAADPLLRLRTGPEADQTSEIAPDHGGKALGKPRAHRQLADGVSDSAGSVASAGFATPAGAAASGGFPSGAGSAAPRSVPATTSFSAHWHVPSFHWPKVCLALEAKAARALDRVAEAILGATREGKKAIGFVSVRRGEGATTLLLCAARRLAERGGRVLVAEANLRHPDLTDQLNVAPQVGWEQLGQRCRTVQEVLIESQADGVTLLPWCGEARRGDEGWGRVGAALAEALRDLRQVYDIVLLDLGALEELEEPSAGAQKDGAVENLLGCIEGLVVVRNVRPGVSQVDIGALRQRLHAAGITVVGIVDNCV